MRRVEEMVAVRVAPPQAMRLLVTPARFAEWVAPDATVAFHGAAKTLGPGDRFRLELVGGVGFDYTVEAATDRDIVLRFEGPWSGEERWSFVADGAETIVRRTYEVQSGGTLALMGWQTVGRPMVAAHFKLELGRFRDAAERDPGLRGEIEGGRGTPREVEEGPRTYTVDEG